MGARTQYARGCTRACAGILQGVGGVSGRRERAGCLAKNGEREGVGIAAMTITAFGQCEAQFVFAGAWRAHGWQCGISSKHKILLMKNLLLATPYLTTSSWWDATAPRSRTEISFANYYVYLPRICL